MPRLRARCDQIIEALTGRGTRPMNIYSTNHESPITSLHFFSLLTSRQSRFNTPGGTIRTDHRITLSGDSVGGDRSPAETTVPGAPSFDRGGSRFYSWPSGFDVRSATNAYLVRC